MSSVEKISSSSKIALNPRKNKVSTEEENSLRNDIDLKENKLIKSDQGFILKEELENAVSETNRIVFGENEKFEFKIHEKTGRYLVKLVDKNTNETIREIPPEKILDLIANIWEMVGILVDERG